MTICTNPLKNLSELRPLADAVGPFPLPGFISAVTEFRGEEVRVVGDDRGALPITIVEGVVLVAGHPDLTDYHSPLGKQLDAVGRELSELVGSGHRLDLDSLPEVACSALVDVLSSNGVEPTADEHSVSAVVALPDSFEEYLNSLSKKQRHEVRRKRRRYEESVGEIIHEAHRGTGWAFDEFIRLHRMSSGDKGDFMTDERRTFFQTLLNLDGWRVDVLRVPGTERAAATLVSYSDESGIYLYNSSYDPDLSDASPGIAIVGTLVEQAIAEGLPRFDFLKGDESYKFRLGAEPRQLYRVTAGGDAS